MGKWAIVTGASSGIGREYAKRLSSLGYDLLITGRRENALSETAKALAGRSEVYIGDFADRNVRLDFYQRVDRLDEISFLVNNAGFGEPVAYRNMKDIAAMIDVHCTLVAELTQHALPKMDKGSTIVNISSIAGILKTPQNAIYSGTKAFVNTFSESLAGELQGTGIKVQSLCPGFTYSDFHDRMGFEDFDRDSIPRWMWMTAEEVVDISLKKSRSTIVIPGLANKLIVTIFSNRFIAQRFIGLARRIFKR